MIYVCTQFSSSSISHLVDCKDSEFKSQPGQLGLYRRPKLEGDFKYFHRVLLCKTRETGLLGISKYFYLRQKHFVP
jgi:hypothetical protein